MSHDPVDFEVSDIELEHFIDHAKNDKTPEGKDLTNFLTSLWAMGDEAKQNAAFNGLNEDDRLVLMYAYSENVFNMCKDPAPDPEPPTREPSS